MKAIVALIMVAVLYSIVYLGAGKAGLHQLFGVIIPYAAIFLFLVGFVYRVFAWGRSKVPFRITTTCGQQKSLDFIKSNNLENPHNTAGAIGRMALEVLFFRSLFRNTKAELKGGPRLVYLRPRQVAVGRRAGVSLVVPDRLHTPLPVLCRAGARIHCGAADARRVFPGRRARALLDQLYSAGERYVSLSAQGIHTSDAVHVADDRLLSALPDLRHRPVGNPDAALLQGGHRERSRSWRWGWSAFNPVVPEGIGFIFFVHLFFVSVLFAYFPFSKLMHLGGVFMSPTRVLVNNSREKRHVNPWNYDVKTHTYEEYEDEFRELMREAGLPLEKK